MGCIVTLFAVTTGIRELARDEPVLWEGLEAPSVILSVPTREKNTSPLNEDSIHVQQPVYLNLLRYYRARNIRNILARYYQYLMLLGCIVQRGKYITCDLKL